MYQGGLCSSLKSSSGFKKGLLVLTKVPSGFCLGDYLLDREATVEGEAVWRSERVQRPKYEETPCFPSTQSRKAFFLNCHKGQQKRRCDLCTFSNTVFINTSTPSIEGGTPGQLLNTGADRLPGSRRHTKEIGVKARCSELCDDYCYFLLFFPFP